MLAYKCWCECFPIRDHFTLHYFVHTENKLQWWFFNFCSAGLLDLFSGWEREITTLSINYQFLKVEYKHKSVWKTRSSKIHPWALGCGGRRAPYLGRLKRGMLNSQWFWHTPWHIYHLQALEFFTLISNLTTKQFAILNRSFTFFYLSAIKRKKYSVSDAEHDNLEKCWLFKFLSTVQKAKITNS